VPDAKTHGVIERQREIDELAGVLDVRIAAEDAAREVQRTAEQHAGRQPKASSARRGVRCRRRSRPSMRRRSRRSS
jgi:chromosome segregation protein